MKSTGNLITPKGRYSLVRSKVLWSAIGFFVLSLALLSSSKDISAIVDNRLDSFVIEAEHLQNAKQQQSTDSHLKHVSISIQPGDTFGTLMRSLGLDYNQSHTLLTHTDAQLWLSNRLKVGKQLDLIIDIERTYLQRLSLQIDPNTRLEANWSDSQHDYHVTLNEIETDKQQVYVEGTIKRSLYLDAQELGVPASVVIAFANILAWDIDFAHDIQAGDSFSILYEKEYINGKQIPLYNILAVRLISRHTDIFAIGYTPDNNDTKSYYTHEGRPVQKAFLRMPLKFGRISSPFNLKRVHPLFGTIRPHKGTDYAAPRHTPIHSVAKGTITFRGWKKGYGNVIIIDHGRGITTLYAHMHNFVKGQKTGSKVTQGQTIGYVGTTGYSTGPHVHYEFKKDGKHLNPATVSLPSGEPLQAQEMEQFTRIRDRVVHVFNIHRRAYYAVNDN